MSAQPGATESLLIPSDFERLRGLLHDPAWLAKMAHELQVYQRLLTAYPFTLDPEHLRSEDLLARPQAVTLDGVLVYPILTRVPVKAPKVFCVIATLNYTPQTGPVYQKPAAGLEGGAYDLLIYEDNPIDISKRTAVGMAPEVIAEIQRQFGPPLEFTPSVFTYLSFMAAAPDHVHTGIDTAGPTTAPQPPAQPTPI